MPKMIGNWIEGATKIEANASEDGETRVRLSYAQAVLLPASEIMASLDTTDCGSKRSLAKRWYRWFASADAILACPSSTCNMRDKALAAKVAALPDSLRVPALDAYQEGRMDAVAAIIAQVATEKITADTITDEQIRELREQAGQRGDTYTVDQTFEALGEWGVFWSHQVPESASGRIGAQRKARAWCAEILNERADRARKAGV